MGVTRRSHRGAEKGYALLSAMVFLVVLLILGSSLLEQTMQELATASRAKKSTVAFHLAEAGVDYAAWQLYNNSATTLPHTWTNTIPGAGSYSVTASSYLGRADTLTLVSTGTFQGYPCEVKEVGRFLTTGPNTHNTIFGNALFSNASLALKGTANVSGNIMANGNVTINGSPGCTGTISSAGTITGGSGFTTQQNVPKEPMPVIDLNYWRSKASVVLPSGSNIPTTVNGVIYVNGDLQLSGTRSITGKGTIVVPGNVTVNSNTVVNLADADSGIAIVCAGSIQTNGNCTIYGFLYAHNVSNNATFSGNGTANIYGGVVADVISKANGTLNVTYVAPTVELPGDTPAPTQFAGISWRQLK